MAVKDSVIRAVVGQFVHPRGVVGHLAGWHMARSSANRRRNAFVVSLLDVQPGCRVLEIGFGPGLAIAELATRVGPSGHVYGIDHSEVMVRHATRRNAGAIRAGRVTLARACVDDLPPTLDRLDVILAVNAMGSWTAPVQRLHDLRRRLRPGGRIAIATQPQHPGSTRDPVLVGRQKADLLRAAGFTVVRTESLDISPPVTCVVAADGGSRTGPGPAGD
jgi:SAM-dependent methyltransferase